MAEPDNLVLALLREFRAEMQELRNDMNTRFDQVEERFGALDRRLDSMQANGIKTLQRFIGNRAIFERTMASVDSDLDQLKKRVDRDIPDLIKRVEDLEAART